MPANPNLFRECLACRHYGPEPQFVPRHPVGPGYHLFPCPICGSADTAVPTPGGADPHAFRECLVCNHHDREPAFLSPTSNFFTCPLCGSIETLGISDSPLLRGDDIAPDINPDWP